MRYANIPGISQPAAVICLGTAMMNDAFDIARAHRILDMYQDIGGNFIDTARVYGLTGDGHSLSERCVGDWLKARGNRERIVLATKGGHYDLATRASRLSPTDITSDCEASLRDLGVDFIDLYWLHRDDERRPVEEIIDTLNALRRRGLIGALGASNWSAARMAAANEYAARSGQAGFVADQPQWSLARQFVCDDDTLVQMNAELYAFHARTGMAVVPFSSQAKGFYSKLAQGGLGRAERQGARALCPRRKPAQAAGRAGTRTRARRHGGCNRAGVSDRPAVPGIPDSGHNARAVYRRCARGGRAAPVAGGSIQAGRSVMQSRMCGRLTLRTSAGGPIAERLSRARCCCRVKCLSVRVTNRAIVTRFVCI